MRAPAGLGEKTGEQAASGQQEQQRTPWNSGLHCPRPQLKHSRLWGGPLISVTCAGRPFQLLSAFFAGVFLVFLSSPPEPESEESSFSTFSATLPLRA